MILIWEFCIFKWNNDSLLRNNVFFDVLNVIFIVKGDNFVIRLINIHSEKINNFCWHYVPVSYFLDWNLQTCLPTFLHFVDFCFYFITIKNMTVSFIIRADVLGINNSLRVNDKSIIVVDVPIKRTLQHYANWICHVKRIMTTSIFWYNMRILNFPL